MSHTEIQEEEEEDEYYNDTPFESVSEECKDIVLKVKRQLYKSIIYGPDLQSKEAQNNALIIIYSTKLRDIYVICEEILNQTNTEEKLQEKIMKFPPETRDAISKLIHYIDKFFRTNQLVETIPYIDYLHVHFRIYPFLQK